MQEQYKQLELLDIESMVLHANKRRHEIYEGKIRALYGHTLKEGIEKEPAQPPEILFHGTSRKSAENIMKEGLSPQGRQYAHLSPDKETACRVGKRKDGNPVILSIDAKRAWSAGILFYHGNENIWLSDLIPPQFIGMETIINVNYDFQAEVGGEDSDRWSKTLQEYHRILWSKPLPNGKTFTLKKISRNRLYHKSELGEFFLSSDRAIATFSRRKQLEHIISQIPKAEIENFMRISDTIGGILIWPSNRIKENMTINGARGFNRLIADRFDLTIECIRQYYLDELNPLYETFKRYSDFFSLFENFKGYVDFFLLQDIVSDDYLAVKIVTPFDNFNTSPIPSNLEEYLIYKDNTTQFVEARNARILQYSQQLTPLGTVKLL